MRNKYFCIICFLYSFIIGYVWFSGLLKNFLAPQMQVYIKCAFFLLIIFGIVMLFIKSRNNIKVSDLFLLLPLILLLLAGDGRISVSLAENRSSNVSTDNRVKIDVEELEKMKKEMNERKVEVVSYDFSDVYFNVKDEIFDDLASYMVYEKAVKYEGKTIKVKGFSVKYSKYLPEGYFALGRYVISCCAADATFNGFFVKMDDHTIIHDKWYEIEGVLEKAVDNDGYQIMAIRIVNIKEIDGSKENQYVYPCYAYDDGECAETKKLNLEI